MTRDHPPQRGLVLTSTVACAFCTVMLVASIWWRVSLRVDAWHELWFAWGRFCIGWTEVSSLMDPPADWNYASIDSQDAGMRWDFRGAIHPDWGIVAVPLWVPMLAALAAAWAASRGLIGSPPPGPPAAQRHAGRRRVERALITLLLAVFISFALSWGALFAAPWEQGLEYRDDAPGAANWGRSVPDYWPPTCHREIWESKGVLFQVYHEGGPRPDVGAGRMGRREFVGSTIASGWPFRCLSSESWAEVVTSYVPGSPVTTVESEDLLEDSLWARGIDLSHLRAPASKSNWKRPPVRPLWAGFITDTLAFAGVIACLSVSFRTTRRWIRIRRSRCPYFGYPAGPLPVCAECGAPVKPRSAHGVLDTSPSANPSPPTAE